MYDVVRACVRSCDVQNVRRILRPTTYVYLVASTYVHKYMHVYNICVRTHTRIHAAMRTHYCICVHVAYVRACMYRISYVCISYACVYTRVVYASCIRCVHMC